jgi:hypothetical protein
MTDPAEVAQDLRAHLALCHELLDFERRENQALRETEPAAFAFEFDLFRKALLNRLDESLARLKKHRAAWQRLGPAERLRHRDIGTLLQQNQDAIMKVVVLDRENEQARLRRSLIPPNQLPAANRQRPHFVAQLYRRHSP